MRISNGLLGEAIQVEEQELQWRKPLDIVRQHARERWGSAAEDLIVLASTGTELAPTSGADALGSDREVFIFLRSALDLQTEASDAADAAAAVAVSACRSTTTEVSAREAQEQEAADASIAEALRLSDMFLAAVVDPAFGAFRNNIAEARRRLAEVRPAVATTARLETHVEVQRRAAQAVLDNLAAHRATCSRSIVLFLQKHERVRERFDQNLDKVEASMACLGTVTLHPALRASGRETLADTLPRERILQFTRNLQAERARLAQRLEKLKKQDAHAQALCDQVVGKVQDFLKDGTVEACASAVKGRHTQAVHELLPALEVRVPSEGAEPSFVLEEEKRSAGVLASLTRICEEIQRDLRALETSWERQRAGFLQRLREVAFIQSKVRSVERQAALLEEEINVQHGQSQQLTHLQKMPKAYQKALSEVDRRHHFKALLRAQADQARSTLKKMVEDENVRRSAFIQRCGCHLPADLVRGLGALVPPPSVELPDFDTQLPQLGQAAGVGPRGDAPGTRRRLSSASGGGLIAGAGALARRELGSSSSSCGSSFRSTCVQAPTAAVGMGVSGAGAGIATSSSGGGAGGATSSSGGGAGGTTSSSGGGGTGAVVSSGSVAAAPSETRPEAAETSGGSSMQERSEQPDFQQQVERSEGGAGHPSSGVSDARRIEELEAQNQALEAHVARLLSQMAAQQQQQSAQSPPQPSESQEQEQEQEREQPEEPQQATQPQQPEEPHTQEQQPPQPSRSPEQLDSHVGWAT